MKYSIIFPIKIKLNIIDQYKKTYLLEKYNDNNNYYHNTYRLGTAELINGDYRTFTKEYELLKNLSNEDIKRVASTYLTNENLFFAVIDFFSNSPTNLKLSLFCLYILINYKIR